MIKNNFCYDFNSEMCAECGGKCCIGESGYIFLSVAEMEAIAESMGMEFAQWTQRFVKKVGYKFSLIEKPFLDGYACVFFDTQNKQCSIYPHRPKQCRTFPFWEVYRPKEMFDTLCKECIGVKLKGEKK
ncbi:hypothetical protein BBW65_05175 [Helicobacter enhydrae]|uniref:YkgJ family cysteine cluster protein n=1 Tax=Helicobacter enhydrae TaxID=222136 RepID=A0A1B1U648_9HELI|nr:YkgJ family cysteine cluster protein [Helicobacter enhydrae]ANV98228.1 hypothetical protein BBW65_05175 [Helicobacter enhydrae]